MVTDSASRSGSLAAAEPAPTACDFFVLRTPLLPYVVLARLSEGLQAARVCAEGGNLEQSLAADRAAIAAGLRTHFNDPVVRDALFLASPSLDDAIEAWLRDPTSSRAHDVPAIAFRYLTRMAGRATPFGLFAGSSLGARGEVTRFTLEAQATYRRHTRIDAQYLEALCAALRADDAVRETLVYGVSTGLYEAAGQVRYPETRVDPQTGARNHHLVSVDRTPYLDAVLARAAGGAWIADLARVLVATDETIEQADAEGFVKQLIDRQILVSELEPPITGSEPLAGVIDVLRPCEATRETAEVLARVGASVTALDEGPLGKPASAYRAIASALRGLPGDADPARVFQVDLYKPATATLGGEPLRELERAAATLARVIPHAPHPSLERFKKRFAERYGEPFGPLARRRMVPLALALDEEMGVGFAETDEPSPLLHGLVFPGDPNASREVPHGRREQRLVRGLTSALREGKTEWALSEADLEALSTHAPPLPDAFALQGSLVAESPAAVDRGEFLLVVPLLPGPSGARLFGRFCHGEPALRRAVEDHLRAEESFRPEATFAEVVHLPAGKGGNVVCRPVLRRYEIPFLGRSGVLPEHRIPIDDLYVTLEGGRITLFSRRLGREVVPRLTSAQNFEGIECLGLYKFLCALQLYGRAGGPSWDWGPVADAPFLPRVRTGKVVFCPARWNLGKDDLALLADKDATRAFRAVQALRARIGLPRHVNLRDDENGLPIDLDNVVSVESWLRLAKGRESLVLEERFGDGHVATGPEGGFVHDFVVPFLRRPASTRPAAPRSSIAAPSGNVAQHGAVGRYAPGSEWLYAMLFCGTASADQILSRVVTPLVRTGRESGAVDRWFFLRYGDPRWHLRIRLHGPPQRLAAEMLPQLHQLAAPLMEEGTITSIELGTYAQEIERYGGAAGIGPAETIFDADSDAVAAIIALLEADEGADARWRLALRGCHLLLVDLGLDLAARADVVRAARASFGVEHHVDKALEVQLGKSFRAERGALEELLIAPEGGEHDLEPGFALLAERSRRIAPAVAELRARERKGQLDLSVPQLAWHFLHMHSNRLLCGAHRRQELVLLDWLTRLYDSELARARSKKAP